MLCVRVYYAKMLEKHDSATFIARLLASLIRWSVSCTHAVACKLTTYWPCAQALHLLPVNTG